MVHPFTLSSSDALISAISSALTPSPSVPSAIAMTRSARGCDDAFRARAHATFRTGSSWFNGAGAAASTSETSFVISGGAGPQALFGNNVWVRVLLKATVPIDAVTAKLGLYVENGTVGRFSGLGIN